jgi:hypothetical protein
LSWPLEAVLALCKLAVRGRGEKRPRACPGLRWRPGTVIRWQWHQALVTPRAVVADLHRQVRLQVMANGRSAADHPREVRRILQTAVGAFARRCIAGRSQPITPADAMIGLACQSLGHAGVCTAGRQRPCLGRASPVSLATEFGRWLPCGPMVLARFRTTVFRQRGPVMGRLLVTKLVLPIGREQVLPVVEALLAEVPT